MNILVIAPHPDDESIGVGGTIRLHVERGDRVGVVFLTSGEAGLRQLPREDAWAVREGEALEAAVVLGTASTVFLRQPDWCLGDHVPQAADVLRPVVELQRPELIYVPHARESHPDHQAAGLILELALALPGGPPRVVLGYEVWTPLEDPDRVENVTSTMKRKLRAIRCYRSQLTGFRYDRAALGLGIYRGALTLGCGYGEVFQTMPRP